MCVIMVYVTGRVWLFYGICGPWRPVSFVNVLMSTKTLQFSDFDMRSLEMATGPCTAFNVMSVNDLKPFGSNPGEDLTRVRPVD